MSPFSPTRPDWSRDGADWPLRAHSRFVEAAGLRWHVQILGDGPTILLLHGTAGASHSWAGAAALLGREFRVVSPDLPGHGFSAPPPRGGHALPAMARAVAALLAQLESAPDAIAGHSAGAAIAARMALDGLAAPRALVAVNGAFLPFPGAAGAAFPALARLMALNPLAPRMMSAAARAGLGDAILAAMGAPADGPQRALYRRLLARPGHVGAALRMMAAWDLETLARDLPRLRPAPALMIGEADRAVPPADAERVAAMIPGARVERLAGLGHLAHEQRPDLAAAFVRRAIESA